LPSIRIHRRELDSLSPEAEAGQRQAEDLDTRGGTKAGLLFVRGKAGDDSISLDGNQANMLVRDLSGDPVLNFAGEAHNGKVAAIWIGRDKAEGGHKAGLVFVRDATGDDLVVIDGAKGDVILSNADCAEDFDVADLDDVEPRTVMVLDDDGRLRPSERAYDTRVVVVVAGGAGQQPAIVLDRRPGAQRERLPIALTGKVFCRVDATHAAVKAGDLFDDISDAWTRDEGGHHRAGIRSRPRQSTAAATPTAWASADPGLASVSPLKEG
jgi:hypothetical protein